MRPTALVAAAATVVVLVTGCAGLHSNQVAPQIYLLGPAPVAAGAPRAAGPAAPAASVTVQVLRPLAAPGLDTEQIALQRDTQRLDYYAASRWPAPLPELVQTLAIDTLRASGKFRAVQPDATAFAADDVLQIEIRACQAEYSHDGSPVVHVQLLATLGRQGDRALVANVAADSSKPASANRMQAVVSAFQEAVSEALTQVAARLAP